MEKYINNIFTRQTESLLKDLIHSYASENGLDGSNIENLIKEQEQYCTTDPWGCLRYNRNQIRNILIQL